MMAPGLRYRMLSAAFNNRLGWWLPVGAVVECLFRETRVRVWVKLPGCAMAFRILDGGKNTVLYEETK